jgi:hypothetical protein
MLVTVRLVALWPGDKRMLTGKTAKACALAAKPVSRKIRMAASALAATMRRYENNRSPNS